MDNCSAVEVERLFCTTKRKSSYIGLAPLIKFKRELTHWMLRQTHPCTPDEALAFLAGYRTAKGWKDY